MKKEETTAWPNLFVFHAILNIPLYVSVDLKEPSARKREVRALTEAMGDTGIREGTILTLENEENIDTGFGAIKVLPTWLWMANRSTKA